MIVEIRDAVPNEAERLSGKCPNRLNLKFPTV